MDTLSPHQASPAHRDGPAAAAVPPRPPERRAGIVLRITIGLAIMAMLVLLIGGVSISSFRLLRAEVSSLSSTTLPEVVAAAELRGSLQQLVARLPGLAGAATMPQRRGIHDELVRELEFLHRLVDRVAALQRAGAEQKSGAREDTDVADARLLDQVRSTLVILAATVADLNGEVGRQIEAGDRQAEAIRALARMAEDLERLSGPDGPNTPAPGPTPAPTPGPTPAPAAGAWAVRTGALMARAAGAVQLDHLNRLRTERVAAERTLADLGRIAASTPGPDGAAMDRIRATLDVILVAPGGLFDSSAERLQARNRAQALFGQSRVLVETVDRSTRALFDALNDRSTQRTDALTTLITDRTRAVMALGGASVLLAIGVYLFFRRFLTSRLVALNGAVLARLSGSAAAVPAEGDDEITDIGASIRYFIEEIDRRQRDLADKERRFRDLVEGSIQGIVIHRDFRPLYANDAFAQMLGTSPGRALSVPSVLDLIPTAERPLVETNYYHILETGQPSERRRLRAFRFDGTELWIELTSRRVDWMGEPAVQSVVVDVTREVEAEAALRRSRDAAEQALRELKETQASLIQAEKMASLGQLVAGVAHEVNTPIGITITGASQLVVLIDELAQKHADGTIKRSDFQRFLADGREMARLILANGTRAADLVQSFKMVAVDQSSDERRRFELKSYVDELLRSLRPTYKDLKGLDIAVDSPEGLEFDSYPGALSQVLTNLIINALTHAFTPDRPGRIAITARALTPDIVELEVADDGIGIPTAIQPKIFDPFFTTRRGRGGSGLGLHIVYNLVTGTLRGTIAVTSIPGEGTRFTLRLPRVAPAAPGPAESGGVETVAV
ncbi:PAS domain-containing sensor histidine kinase [Azospirillum rugosum]|uniref:histidine kinase n=1 Tax=Azospirillum rugosum TaxID=416170 RepID=A0ABS4SHW4_9PROT|nr:PAS domain-containing sensor histidine kinase [Azospirillum rugosum]MBP2291638.1 PAS domain S-box-containing protein [Azospirillum rugosum]MDQ0524550.1 PAS domain S-box-containing protein [Azospirillum rugosum]